MNTIEPGRDAPQADIPLTISRHEIARLSTTDLLDVRLALYGGWTWPDICIPILEPIWLTLIDAVEAQLAITPPRSWAELCLLTVAVCDADEEWEHGADVLRQWAEMALRGAIIECPLK
jgi:hypothetical protein